VPGPGTLTLSGKALVAKQATASAAGTIQLTVKAKGKAAKKLKKKGKLKAGAVVTFTPTGGDPSAQTRSLKLIRRG
jgi:hypothetical protein